MKDEKPVTKTRPAVVRLMATGVVWSSAAISLATLKSEVEAKVALSATQLSTNTINHFRQVGRSMMLGSFSTSFSSDAIDATDGGMTKAS